ncbi:hypothetical protein THUN1656_03270 [Rodentibacter abscessus]
MREMRGINKKSHPLIPAGLLRFVPYKSRLKVRKCKYYNVNSDGVRMDKSSPIVCKVYDEKRWLWHNATHSKWK